MPISIMAFPKCGDAYTRSFYDALEKQGALVTDGIYSGRWLLSHLQGVDYLHVNWPSFFYRASTPTRTMWNLGRLVVLLLCARALGVKLLWTAHNLYPHDRSKPPLLDWVARWIVIKLAFRVYVHGETAATLVRTEFPISKKKISIIQHGHFVDLHKRSTTRQSARKRLGIPDNAFVFLFLGTCKPYKALDLLVHTFQTRVSDAELLIVGKFQDPLYYDQITKLVDTNRRGIRVENRYIDDDELEYYLVGADVFVSPYSEVLTSGSVMLGLSFGLPVVAPRLGHLAELITERCGVVYDPGDPEGLGSAMQEIRNRTYDDHEIIAYARTYDWTEIAESFLASLKSTARSTETRRSRTGR